MRAMPYRSAKLFYEFDGATLEKIVYYVYDGWQVVEEHKAMRTGDIPPTLSSPIKLVADYIYGIGIDEPLRMRRDLNNDGHFNKNEEFYYHENGIGSIYAVTDSNGDVIERYDYTTYGVPTIYASDGITILDESSIANPYLFHARRLDYETRTDNYPALIYYRHRIYNPQLHRFLQPNPSTWGTAQNRYSGSLASNPINVIDPMGLDGKKKRNKSDELGEWYFKLPGYDWLQKKYYLEKEIERLRTELQQAQNSLKEQEAKLEKDPANKRALVAIDLIRKGIENRKTDLAEKEAMLNKLSELDPVKRVANRNIKPQTGVEILEPKKAKKPLNVLVVTHSPTDRHEKWASTDLAKERLGEGWVIIKVMNWDEAVEGLRIVGAKFGVGSIARLDYVGLGVAEDAKEGYLALQASVKRKRVNITASIVKENTPSYLREYFAANARVNIFACRVGQHKEFLGQIGEVLLGARGGRVRARSGIFWMDPAVSALLRKKIFGEEIMPERWLDVEKSIAAAKQEEGK